jgi:hypothetical protein
MIMIQALRVPGTREQAKAPSIIPIQKDAIVSNAEEWRNACQRCINGTRSETMLIWQLSVTNSVAFVKGSGVGDIIHHSVHMKITHATNNNKTKQKQKQKQKKNKNCDENIESEKISSRKQLHLVKEKIGQEYNK